MERNLYCSTFVMRDKGIINTAERDRILLCLAHMSGEEQKYVKEAFVGECKKVVALSSEPEAKKIARRMSFDVSVFDQSGCTSPHNLYIERGGAVSPERFCEILT